VIYNTVYLHQLPSCEADNFAALQRIHTHSSSREQQNMRSAVEIWYRT